MRSGSDRSVDNTLSDVLADKSSPEWVQRSIETGRQSAFIVDTLSRLTWTIGLQLQRLDSYYGPVVIKPPDRLVIIRINITVTSKTIQYSQWRLRCSCCIISNILYSTKLIDSKKTCTKLRTKSLRHHRKRSKFRSILYDTILCACTSVGGSALCIRVMLSLSVISRHCRHV